MKKFIKEFKEFAVKGNVLDMAVGVVVGGAFSKIVSSLVSDIIMPAISLLTGKVSLKDLSFTLQTGGEPIVLSYGIFLQTVLDFFIIALSIFLFIKLINRFHRKKEEAPKPSPQPSKEEILLTEIRDLMAQQVQPSAQSSGKTEPPLLPEKEPIAANSDSSPKS